MNRILLAGLVAVAPALTMTSQTRTPVWLENDSARAIKSRLLSDFSVEWEEAVPMFGKEYGIDRNELERWEKEHYIETRVIDGVKRVHRKSLRNARLLNPELNGGAPARGQNASASRVSYVDSVLQYSDGVLPDGGAHRVTYSFTITVPYNDALKDDTLKVWMPYPMTTARQPRVELISTSQPDFTLSGARSDHSTIYMCAPVREGQPTVFSYTASFDNRGQYFSEGHILNALKPYDKNSALYKKYTAVEAPHIIDLRQKALEIVGNETNPYRQAEAVFDYIIERYPWAGAREYSTIECIPEYVVKEKHGDCGQVSLLFISLMRSLGVPARWESGWMLHPGEKNLHDWAEVYYEGVGWVPVDVSFGRYGTGTDGRTRGFYSKGMDAHRLAANRTVCGEFYPAKRYVRSETVDSQLGEVESTRGNLFYPGWDQSLKLIDIHPIIIQE